MKFHKIRLSEKQVKNAIHFLGKYKFTVDNWQGQTELKAFLKNFLESLEKQTSEEEPEEENEVAS
jgi:hypothetical protein